MKKIIGIIVLLVVMISCKKEYLQPRSGIFRGTFEMTDTEGDGFETGDCSIALNDKSGSFSLSADTTSSYPYSCNGLYLITDATKMNFTSSHLAPL